MIEKLVSNGFFYILFVEQSTFFITNKAHAYTHIKYLMKKIEAPYIDYRNKYIYLKCKNPIFI